MIEPGQLQVSRQYTKDSGNKIYIETYGCQMNFNDSEVVVAIMQKEGFAVTENIKEADLILINTCSIRDNAEKRIFGRLREFATMKRKKPSLKVGVIGCMAERMKEQLLEKEKTVDLIAGPDAYRDLPALVAKTGTGMRAANVILSHEETYADINPVRLDENHVTAYISIMRGCENFCAYCVVPYTRGGERSRDPETIVNEARNLFDAGYREVTLLGQNVNSYLWKSSTGANITFPKLIELVALVDPKLRVRFATSHPKDLSDDLLRTMAKYKNICRNVHLPAQSGSNNILRAMKRGYTREWYLQRMAAIKHYLPESSISTDLIAGFCGETEEDHQQTLSLMREVGYEMAYMFKYSQRPGTYAADNLADDVPEDVKSRRLTEIIDLQHALSAENKKKDIGKTFEVLVEAVSKKSKNEMYGRTSQNNIVVFPKNNLKPGDYVMVEITGNTQATLKGKVVS